MNHIVGIDPGFASVGYVVLTLDYAPKVVEFGVLRTKKSPKKRNLLSTEDNLQRARTLTKGLQDILELRPFTIAICAESMSFPRNASSAAKVAMCWGILEALAFVRDIPILQASPQEVKASITGSRSAAKDYVQRALLRIYKECAHFEETIPSSQREHPYDALAVAHHVLGTDFARARRELAAQ